MGVVDTLRIDTRAENFAIEYNDEYADWLKVLKKYMNVRSIKTWYPTFDAKSFKFKDERVKYRDTDDLTSAKDVSFEYTENLLTLHGYKMKSRLSERKIQEAKSSSLNDIIDDHVEGMVTKINTFLNLDLFGIIGNAALWPTAVGGAWDGAGDPQMDVLRIVKPAFNLACYGIRQINTMILGSILMSYLKTNAIIRTLIQYNQLPVDNMEGALSALFGIKNIIVIDSVYDTAALEATPTPTDIWSTSAWFGYIEPNPTVRKPTSIAALVPKDEIGNSEGMRVYTARAMNGTLFEDDTNGVRTVYRNWINIKRITRSLGFVLTGLYTP